MMVYRFKMAEEALEITLVFHVFDYSASSLKRTLRNMKGNGCVPKNGI